jgi:hypothetical protein
MPRGSRRYLVVASALLVLGLSAPDSGAVSADPAPTPAPLVPLEPTPEPTPTVSPTPMPTPEPTPGPGAVDPRTLPDLALIRIGDLRLLRVASGGLQLRFSSTLVNVGAGPMIIRATRKGAEDSFTVAQQIRTRDGRHPFRRLPVSTVFAGDGHSHWHIRDVARYTLIPMGEDSRTRTRRIQKVGFCLYDNERRVPRRGRPTRPEFVRDGCGMRDSTLVRMGLSVGWGDLYASTLLGQYVSLTGLPAGDYRLLGRVNPDAAFYEQRTGNNTVYTDIRLRRDRGKGPSIKILRSGFRPPADRG